MRLLKKLNNILVTTVFVVGVLMLIVFGWSATGWKALAIPTGSMRPSIPPGSLVLVRRVPISSLKVGDIITYINPLRPSTTLSHRIVKKYLIDGKVTAFITKGDANNTTDPPITSGSVEGQVVGHIPEVGSWIIATKQPYIVLPIIYMISILIMVEEVRRLSDYLQTQQPYLLRRVRKEPKNGLRKTALGGSIATALIIVGLFLSPTVLALLKSNTVVLANNHLKVATLNSCSENSSSNTSVNVNSTSTQSATTGNASSSNGNATSGNASNNSSTDINISVNNC